MTCRASCGRTASHADASPHHQLGKDGKITVEVNGVRGPACRELVRETVEKLGVELSVELKPEYFDQAEEKEQEKNRF